MTSRMPQARRRASAWTRLGYWFLTILNRCDTSVILMALARRIGLLGP